MNNEKNELTFGKRKIQKVRHSYTVIIPKALVSALGIKEGDSADFVLDSRGKILLDVRVSAT